ncbi:hypothetical protein HK098_000234 [Nowakowskiella sp. JEL0407]|nr:hypothetical protein HK098_000234 [Nowakowskiella sp. JEL0407]
MEKQKKEIVGDYENKLRNFSHPKKVFNYFASVTKNGEKLMTVKDFIRSIIPYKKHINNGEFVIPQSVEQFFHVADLDGDGYINFSEYMIFLTLLGTPEYQWKLSFKLFDINGDGLLQKSEFEQFILQHTIGLGIGSKLGAKERNISLSSTGLSQLFFGSDGKKSLSLQEFIAFMQSLHLQVLLMEFNQFPTTDSTISIFDWGRAVIGYADERKVGKYLSNLGKVESSATLKDERISFQQFFEFDNMIKTRLHDIGMAYRFYKNAHSDQGHISRGEFKRIIRAVTKLDLTDGQVEVLFAVFDESGDNILDSKEFFQTFQKRQTRGLDSNKTLTGDIQNWVVKVWECVREN